MLSLTFLRKIVWHLLLWMSLITLLFLHSQVYGQGDGKNKPKIKSQRTLSTNEDQSLTIQLTDLEVEDEDDWFYPYGFTLTVYAGSNYQVSGNSIKPATNFSGQLTVPVSVNDGDHESNKFDLKITVVPVNDAPVITGQQTINTTNTAPVTLTPSHLIINDPDDNFPNDFSIIVSSGANYTVNGTTVTPSSSFSGNLSVPVKASDGSAESNTFNLVINVSEGQKEPRILNQKPIIINEDQTYTIEFADLVVSDADDVYPNGFSMVLENGENYTVTERTVTPAKDFSGNLFVKTRVNDGQYTSPVFNFLITVRPVNDPPLIDLKVAAFNAKRSADSLRIFDQATISDPDNETLNLVEVWFDPASFQQGDILFAKSTPAINAVVDAGAGKVTFFGKASLAEYEAALRSVAVIIPPLEGAPAEELKTLFLVANDGVETSEPVSKQLRISENASGFAALDIPTGFTPNGDTVNDTWNIQPLEDPARFAAATIRVYNRNGLMVFETVGIENEWDGMYKGNLLPADVYFYTIDFNEGGSNGLVKGTVTILR